MKGKHRVVVSTKRLKYDFEIRRNLTIIRGDSATGKTTLVEMIQDYVNNPAGTPVKLPYCWLRSLTVSCLLMKEMNLSRQKNLPRRFRKRIIIM